MRKVCGGGEGEKREGLKSEISFSQHGGLYRGNHAVVNDDSINMH